MVRKSSGAQFLSKQLQEDTYVSPKGLQQIVSMLEGSS